MVFDAIHPDDRSYVQDAISAAPGNDGKLSTEARVVRPDGDTRIVAVHARIIYSDEGEPTGVWGTAQDVTAQREAEHALLATTTELAREQTIVDQLQRAILPRMPVVQGCEVAARYLPAGTGAQVGGDWYDIFLIGDRLAFSIGDVAGHGLEAASLMAQLRNALRGAAYCGASVSESLAAVDRLVADQAGDEFATCIFGTLALDTRHLEWANAGHPPLLMVAPGAAPEYLPSADQPPLGVGATTGRINELDLGPGSLVVAYTDGLIEQPSESLDVGLARLSALVDQYRTQSADALCESVGLTMFTDRDRRDDVCILAVRIEP
jgi:serine phosphatase RsbU (regulator of sigma subunit)